MTELTRLLYGSHLYGTNTPTSDFDFKIITLPPIEDLLLGLRLSVHKRKYDERGERLSEEVSMPAGGWEEEIIPVQKFVTDFMTGQAYAVEVAFAQLRREDSPFTELCGLLTSRFLHKNVNGMVGFAVKQTFDYVRRGERYNSALRVLECIDVLQREFLGTGLAVRLSTELATLQKFKHESGTVMDWIALHSALELGTSTNQRTVMRTLKLNGREYLETTTLQNFRTAVEKLRDQYGERSTRAASTDVDWKSLSHAVRVYNQVIELLQTKRIAFPRPNAEELTRIKKGEVPIEQVTELLRRLDDQVTLELARSTLPDASELNDDLHRLFFSWLREQYGLGTAVRAPSA